MDGDVICLSLKAKIVQELCRKRAAWLQIPCLVQDGVVAGLDNARGQVKVDDILSRGSVSQKDAREVIEVKFAASDTRLFDTYL